MSDYLKEIDFATRNLLPIIWGERNRLRELEGEVASLTRQVAETYSSVESIAQMEAETLPPGPYQDDGVGTAMYWECYFGPDKERHHKDKDRAAMAARVASHQFSAASLAGSLLQHAKQGISLAHGSLTACPDGRQVTASQTLKNVIWQGRNQGIHWEEGKPHPPVVQCFDALTLEVGPAFADYKTRNLALDVVELLRWTDFDKFRADMLLLA
jgi:hypothetical protein